MSKFIQIHTLTSYPPANLNRDDMGRPKTAKMGGVDRLRISSQSIKRAWRTSELFKSAMSGHIGTRTKELGHKVYKMFIKKGIEKNSAKEWTQAIAGVFGKLKAENKKDPEKLEEIEIEQLAHISPEEIKAVDELVDNLIKEKRAPNENELELLRHPETAVDIALFGRMLASIPAYNVEAACQVSHPVSVHSIVIEDDYFTAVDELNEGKEDMGAGHIGERGFASALFYNYICIDCELLIDNLGKDKTLANKTLTALLETVLKVAPEGMQNSFASRAWASYVLVEKGDVQPRSLLVAFLKPIKGDNVGEDAVKVLEKTYENIDKVYEISEIERKKINAFTGEGKISELLKFIQE